MTLTYKVLCAPISTFEPQPQTTHQHWPRHPQSCAAVGRRCEEGEPMMVRRLFYALVLAAFLASAVVTGCAPVTVQQTTLQRTYTGARADVLSTGELSQMTQQVMRMQGLHAETQEPARAFQDLDARSTREPDDDQQVALVELALWNAMRQESSNPTAAEIGRAHV